VNETYGPEHRADPALSVLKLRAAQALDVATARLARRFHAVSEHVADTMARHLLLDRSRIDVIPRGRDPRTLGVRTPERRQIARQTLGVVDEPLVVTLARHEYQKGLDVLLDAVPTILARRPDAQFIVAGREGAESDALARQADRLGITSSVRMLGMRDDAPDLLCAADVFVLPSRREGMPGSVIEAIALRAPVVASDIAQVREVVDSEMATLVQPSSPSDLALAVLGVLNHPHSTAECVRRAHARFLDRFTIDAVVAQMIDFYERALEG
jgi:glycosyltransferase involved in cell wall biosynthesis